MNYEEYTKPNGPWKTIDGWNEQGSFTALAIIDDIQREKRIHGNIGEIGVHEGQLFCALALLSNPRIEESLAIDVFDDQRRNLDKSGGASYEKFRTNVGRIIGDRQNRYNYLETDSLYTNPEDIFDKIGVNSRVFTNLFRLFSIDGGHTVVHVLNDLRLVERIMAPGGVVIVDDFMHPKWPGVTEGLHIYCSDQKSRLVPFAYGNGKMYLTTFDSRDDYIGFSSASKKLIDSKVVEMYGRKMIWARFK